MSGSISGDQLNIWINLISPGKCHQLPEGMDEHLIELNETSGKWFRYRADEAHVAGGNLADTRDSFISNRMRKMQIIP